MSRVKLVFPLLLMALLFSLAWLPSLGGPLALPGGSYEDTLASAFRTLALVLVLTVLLTMTVASLLAFLLVLLPPVGTVVRVLLELIDSVPSLLVTLVGFAPFALAMATSPLRQSSLLSLEVFCGAASVTALPEATRRLSIVLSDLYSRRYSFAFRSYGLTSAAILRALMRSQEMGQTLKGSAVNVLLKTLILDSSFGFLIQLGFGSYGRPSHSSPGALIAAWRDTLVTGHGMEHFWIPVAGVVVLTLLLLWMLDSEKP